MSNGRFSIIQAKAVRDRRISDAQFRTLAALGCYGNMKGWCFPSLKKLGSVLTKSPQAVSKDLGELVKLGYIEKQARFDINGGQKSNIYRLKLDLPDTDDVSENDMPDDISEVEHPSTSEVKPLSTSEVKPLSTSEVKPLSTSEVDHNDHINDPINDQTMTIGRSSSSLFKIPDEIPEEYHNIVKSFVKKNPNADAEYITKAWRYSTRKPCDNLSGYFERSLKERWAENFVPKKKAQTVRQTQQPPAQPQMKPTMTKEEMEAVNEKLDSMFPNRKQRIALLREQAKMLASQNF